MRYTENRLRIQQPSSSFANTHFAGDFRGSWHGKSASDGDYDVDIASWPPELVID